MEETLSSYVVKPGDCFSNIAQQAGLHWETIWLLPQNTELRERRQDPNILYPGDVVAVPQKSIKEISKPTGAQHLFVKKGTPTKVRLRLLQEGEPRSSVPYIFKVDGTLHEGKTDSEGYLSVPIPCTAKIGKLILQSDNGQEEEYDVHLGHLDPLKEIKGIQKRLRNLGYECEISGALDDSTKSAIAAFSAKNKVAGGEEINDKFVRELKVAHGS